MGLGAVNENSSYSLEIRGWLSASHYYCIPSQKSDISYKTDTNLYLEGLRLATLQQQINITVSTTTFVYAHCNLHNFKKIYKVSFEVSIFETKTVKTKG